MLAVCLRQCGTQQCEVLTRFHSLRHNARGNCEWIIAWRHSLIIPWLAGAVWNANEPPNNVTAWIKIGIFNSRVRFSQQPRQVHRGIAFKNTILVVEAQFYCWWVYFHLFTFSSSLGYCFQGLLIVESLSRGKNLSPRQTRNEIATGEQRKAKDFLFTHCWFVWLAARSFWW